MQVMPLAVESPPGRASASGHPLAPLSSSSLVSIRIGTPLLRLCLGIICHLGPPLSDEPVLFLFRPHSSRMSPGAITAGGITIMPARGHASTWIAFVSVSHTAMASPLGSAARPVIPMPSSV